MRTIGLLGGMSWDSSATYYRIVNEGVRARRGGHACARVVLVSLDFAEVRAMQIAGDWDGAASLLADGAQRLERAGAGSIVLCTNYMHKLAPALEQAVDVPVLHIADAVAEAARARGFERLGLLGARPVMQESFYADRLAAHAMSVVVPEEPDRTLVDRVVFDELTQGVLSDSSRQDYVEVIGRLAERGAQAVILGCTEIGLLVAEADTPVPLLDSALLHAQAAVEWSLADS